MFWFMTFVARFLSIGNLGRSVATTVEEACTLAKVGSNVSSATTAAKNLVQTKIEQDFVDA